jgi:hypothetical protein
LHDVREEVERSRRDPALQRHWKIATERLRPHRSKIPLVGVTPPVLLAVYALTKPWAKARALGVLGISKSPEAALLLIMSLAALVAVSVAATMRGHRLRIAATVHFLTGLFMCAVAVAAYRMVLGAGKKLLGIPLARVHPGPGLRLFAAAAAIVLLLGGVELIVARHRRSP